MSTLPEEPLESEIGYFPVQSHQKLNSGRHTVVRKLGWGPRSAVWLILDSQDKEYWAAKILTAQATEHKSATQERDLLRGPVSNMGLAYPRLVNSFHEVDIKGKRHLCPVLDVLGHSVEDIRLTNPNGALPLHYVQKIVGDISQGLMSVSSHKIKHGAVTADNFLFFVGSTPDAVEGQLAKVPTKKPWEVVGSDGQTYQAWKSQAFVNGYGWDTSADEIMYAHIYLNNFGHASQVALPGSNFPQRNYLPPEVFQGAKVDAKADVWMLACTTYFLLTGSPLFSESYIESPIKTATQTVGQLEKLLTESGKLSQTAIPSTAAFLRACLTISPRKRLDPEEIYEGLWTRTADCGCGWCTERDPLLS